MKLRPAAIVSWLSCFVAITTAAGKQSALLVHGEYGTRIASLKDWFNRPHSQVNLKETQSDSSFEGRLFDAKDEMIVNNMILLSSRIPSKLNSHVLMEYVKRGGNLLWVLPAGLSEIDQTTRAIALEFGRILDPQPPLIVDYQREQSSTEEIPLHLNQEIAQRVFSRIPQPHITLTGNERLKAFSHRLDPANPLVFPIIAARKEARGVCPADIPLTRCVSSFGTDNIIASALETRVGSRVVIVSSDSWLKEERGELSPLISELLSWTFKETGHLKVTMEHELYPEKEHQKRPKHDYHLHDQMQVKVCFENDQGFYQPSDAQVELILMDPIIRADLIPEVNGRCLQTTPITLPWTQGIYTLRLRYQRHGWPHIVQDDYVYLRQIHDDEKPRFYQTALPYNLSWVVSMLLGVSIMPFLLKN